MQWVTNSTNDKVKIVDSIVCDIRWGVLTTGFTPSWAHAYLMLLLRPWMYGCIRPCEYHPAVALRARRGRGWAARVFFARVSGNTWFRWSFSCYFFVGWQMLPCSVLVHFRAHVTVLGWLWMYLSVWAGF